MSARVAFCRQVWHQMVAFYGVSSVSPLCLALQDEFDADVPLLLFLVLAEEAGEGLQPADAERLRDAAGAWRSLAVLPLRRIRVTLKDRATTHELQSFRAAIKASELEAERLEVLRLAELFEPLCGPADLAAAYLSHLGVPPNRLGPALDVLRAGAQSLTSPSKAP